MVKCSVVGCINKTKVKRPGISFHKFPKDHDLRLRWLNAINRPEFKPTEGSRVCSHHFNVNDINYTLNRQRLKDDACPFLRIPNLPPGKQAKQLLQEKCPETNYNNVSQSKIQDIALPSTSQSGTPTAHLHKSNRLNYDDVPQTTVQDIMLTSTGHSRTPKATDASVKDVIKFEDKSLGICQTVESEQNVIRKLKKQNLILRKKLKILNQKTRRQKKKIISLKSLHTDLIKKTNDKS